MFIRSLATLTLLCGAQSVASALEIGLGASVGQNETSVRVPLQWESFLLEPLIYDWRQKDTAGTNFEYSSTGVAVGAFYRTPLAEKTSLLVGPRVGYIYNTSESSDKLTNDGISFEGLVGIEHRVLPPASLGIEAGYSASMTKVDSSSNEDGSTSRGSTVARIVLRLYLP